MIKGIDLIENINKKIPNLNIEEDESSIKLSTMLSSKEILKIKNIDFDELFSVIGNFISVYFIDKSDLGVDNHNFNGENYDYADLKDYLKQISEIEGLNIKFRMNIPKNKIIEENGFNMCDKSYLFFFYDNVIDWLKNMNFNELKEYFSSNNLLIILNKNINLENNYLKVFGGKFINNIEELKYNEEQIEEVIQTQHQFCVYSNWSELPPDIFFLKNNIDEEEISLVDQFNLIGAKLLLVFLANRIETNCYNTVVINGYKKVKIKLDNISIDTIKNKMNSAINLYKWVYKNKSLDKLEIVRNSISLHLSDNQEENAISFFSKIDSIYNASKSTFKSYIQDKMNVYFNERKQIELQVYDRIKDLDFEIRKILNLFSKNILGIIGAAITMLVGYLTKNLPVQFIKYVIFSSALFIGVNTAYYSIYTWNSKEHIIKMYNKYIKHCYDILTKEEVHNIIGLENKDEKTKDIMDEKEKLFIGYFVTNIFIAFCLIILLILAGNNIDQVISVFSPKV